MNPQSLKRLYHGDFSSPRTGTCGTHSGRPGHYVRTSVQCTLGLRYSVPEYTVHIQCTLCKVYTCTDVYSVYCSMYTVVYSVYCIRVHWVRCTEYTVQCTLYPMYCVHCTGFRGAIFEHVRDDTVRTVSETDTGSGIRT